MRVVGIPARQTDLDESPSRRLSIWQNFPLRLQHRDSGDARALGGNVGVRCTQMPDRAVGAHLLDGVERSGNCWRRAGGAPQTLRQDVELLGALRPHDVGDLAAADEVASLAVAEL